MAALGIPTTRALAALVDHFAEQDGTPVPELRDPDTELMSGIGHRQRRRARWQPLAREDLDAFRRAQLVWIEAQMPGERAVEPDKMRRWHPRGREPGEEVLRQARVAVVEGEINGGCHDVLAEVNRS